MFVGLQESYLCMVILKGKQVRVAVKWSAASLFKRCFYLQWWLSGDSMLKWSLEHALITFNEVLQRENGVLHVISVLYQQQFVQILLLLVQHHNPLKAAVAAESTLFCHLSALMNLGSHPYQDCGLHVFHMRLPAISLDSLVSVRVPDYIPALCPTSSPPVMWVAVSSWAPAPESQRSE